jgi:hypothetical protein
MPWGFDLYPSFPLRSEWLHFPQWLHDIDSIWFQWTTLQMYCFSLTPLSHSPAISLNPLVFFITLVRSGGSRNLVRGGPSQDPVSKHHPKKNFGTFFAWLYIRENKACSHTQTKVEAGCASSSSCFGGRCLASHSHSSRFKHLRPL